MTYNSFIFFLIYYLTYFVIFVYINYIISNILKFFIKNLIGYDLWTYIDNSFRFCPNNTLYDFTTHNYIIDYEYFNIIEMIYYHDNFLDPVMLDKELIYYYDLFHETRTREDDDHELYGLMSTYIIPLNYQYYLLEHYWPEDDKVSVLWSNFYNFADLESEFKFIYNDYKILWPNYKQFLHTRDLFYNYNLYNSNILQFYFYLYNANYKYSKLPLSYIILLNNKNIFWKKEYRTFDLIEPSQLLLPEKYMTWFLLKTEYDQAKSDFDVFCNLSPYEVFDVKYYDFFISPTNNLIDLQTKRYQFIENSDEFFFDFINSDNCLNYYYFDLTYIKNYNIKRVENYEIECDKPYDLFDYFFFFFSDRSTLVLNYLFIILYSWLILFLFFVCYYCWFHHIYAFDFDVHFNYIRMLTRHRVYNNYIDYEHLIFNYNKNDISNVFFMKNLALKLNNQNYK